MSMDFRYIIQKCTLVGCHVDLHVSDVRAKELVFVRNCKKGKKARAP
jgi:hypothetical protein